MSKYLSKRVTVWEYTFDSKVEAEYYNRLLMMQVQWDIDEIKVHPKYLLQEAFSTVDGKKVLKVEYIADFEVLYSNGIRHVIDIKWMPTETALLKRKLFMGKYRLMILNWLVKYSWEWVDYRDNEKRKRDNKKAKKSLAIWK